MAGAKSLVIMKAGSAPTPLVARMGDFEDWIRQATGDDIRLTVVDAQGPDRLPEVIDVAGVILTGSQAMVTDREPWSLALEKWAASAVHQGVPTLGICYGHQLLAQALGGEVVDRRQGVEIGTVEVIRLAGGNRTCCWARFRKNSARKPSIGSLWCDCRPGRSCSPGPIRTNCMPFDTGNMHGESSSTRNFHPTPWRAI